MTRRWPALARLVAVAALSGWPARSRATTIPTLLPSHGVHVPSPTKERDTASTGQGCRRTATVGASAIRPARVQVGPHTSGRRVGDVAPVRGGADHGLSRRLYDPSMTSSLRTLEQRLRAVEARLAEVEGGYGDTLYELPRASVRNELRLGRVLEHLAISDVTDDEVDEALDTD